MACVSLKHNSIKMGRVRGYLVIKESNTYGGTGQQATSIE